jgi:dihydroflavonol-4-reductase
VFTLIANNFNKKPPHKKVTPFIAALVWRFEALKSFFTRKEPLLTKETSKTAMTKVHFDHTKLLQALPAFSYATLEQSISRICTQYMASHSS